MSILRAIIIIIFAALPPYRKDYSSEVSEDWNESGYYKASFPGDFVLPYIFHLSVTVISSIYVLYIYGRWINDNKEPNNIKKLPKAHLCMLIYHLTWFITNLLYNLGIKILIEIWGRDNSFQIYVLDIWSVPVFVVFEIYFYLKTKQYARIMLQEVNTDASLGN